MTAPAVIIVMTAQFAHAESPWVTFYKCRLLTSDVLILDFIMIVNFMLSRKGKAAGT